MLFLSYGMQKSASSFVFRVTQRLAEAAGSDQERLRQEFLPPDLRAAWGKIVDADSEPPPGEGTLLRIDRVVRKVPDDAILVIKTHSPPPKCVARMLQRGQVRASLSSRDPRDIAVSILDAGRKNRRPDATRHDFTHIHTMDHALRAARWDMLCYHKWLALESVLRLPYPLIKGEPYEVGRRLVEAMGVEVDHEPVVASFLEDGIPNFNVGLEGRHRRVMKPEELAQADELFGDFRG